MLPSHLNSNDISAERTGEADADSSSAQIDTSTSDKIENDTSEPPVKVDPVAQINEIADTNPQDLAVGM